MIFFERKWQVTLWLIALLALCACGGGSSGTSAGNASALPPSSAGTSSSQPLLYVANVVNVTDSAITIYDADANGNVPPVASISGPRTQLSDAGSVAIDASGRIYVANTALQGSGPSCITIYPPGSSGNVAPEGTICGSNTGILRALGKLQFDASGNLWVTTWNSGAPGQGAVLEFAAGAMGNIAPIRTIQGEHTEFLFPTAVAVNAEGTVYVSNAGGQGPPPDCAHVPGFVAEYAAGASGDAAPVVTIRGPDTSLEFVLDLTLDRLGNLYVDSQDVIAVFSPGASGDARPIARITNPPQTSEGIALDTSGNIYVSEVIGALIDVFPPLASLDPSGHTSPVRVISGPNTALNGPVGITVR